MRAVTEVHATLELGAFKHVVVPIGVVIALGVTRIVSATSSYVQHRDRVRFSWAHGAWCVVLFLLFVALWWIAWGLRLVDAELWTFFTLIFLLLGPCLMYLGATLLLPDLPGAGELDLGARFDQLGRPFFLTLAGFVVWLAVSETWLLDEPFLALPKRGIQATALGIFLVGAALPSRRTAGVLAGVGLPLLLVVLATVRARLV